MVGVTTIIEDSDAAIVVTADPAFAPVATTKIVTFTRLLSVASGTQAITGVGFMPRLIQFQTGISGGAGWASIGQASAAAQGSIEFTAGTFFYQSAAGIQRDASGNYQAFSVASFDVDGFTLTWTKVGTPTATASVTATCFR